ncbi:MAG: hypothetical protein RLZZ479_718 [Bacteroidota bacterium]|jgi:hypothetical protein
MEYVQTFESFIQNQEAFEFFSNYQVEDFIEINNEKLTIKSICNNNLIAENQYKELLSFSVIDGLDNKKLIERNIGAIKSTIPMKVILNTTTHAEIRKFRHGYDNEIKDNDIVDQINKALPKIANNQLKGIDEIGQKYWIRNDKNFLNIIGALKNDSGNLIFVIITVMVKKDFIGSTDTKKISV